MGIMDISSNISLQGIYRNPKVIIYLAWEPNNKCFKYKILEIGTCIGSCDSMRNFGTAFSLIYEMLKPLRLGVLSSDIIPSDLYPELFI